MLQSKGKTSPILCAPGGEPQTQGNGVRKLKSVQSAVMNRKRSAEPRPHPAELLNKRYWDDVRAGRVRPPAENYRSSSGSVESEATLHPLVSIKEEGSAKKRAESMENVFLSEKRRRLLKDSTLHSTFSRGPTKSDQSQSSMATGTADQFGQPVPTATMAPIKRRPIAAAPSSLHQRLPPPHPAAVLFPPPPPPMVPPHPAPVLRFPPPPSVQIPMLGHPPFGVPPPPNFSPLAPIPALQLAALGSSPFRPPNDSVAMAALLDVLAKAVVHPRGGAEQKSPQHCPSSRALSSRQGSSSSDQQIDEIMDQMAVGQRHNGANESIAPSGEECAQSSQSPPRLCIVPIPFPVPVPFPVSIDFIMQHFGGGGKPMH